MTMTITNDPTANGPIFRFAWSESALPEGGSELQTRHVAMTLDDSFRRGRIDMLRRDLRSRSDAPAVSRLATEIGILHGPDSDYNPCEDMRPEDAIHGGTVRRQLYQWIGTRDDGRSCGFVDVSSAVRFACTPPEDRLKVRTDFPPPQRQPPPPPGGFGYTRDELIDMRDEERHTRHVQARRAGMKVALRTAGTAATKRIHDDLYQLHPDRSGVPYCPAIEDV